MCRQTLTLSKHSQIWGGERVCQEAASLRQTGKQRHRHKDGDKTSLADKPGRGILGEWEKAHAVCGCFFSADTSSGVVILDCGARSQEAAVASLTLILNMQPPQAAERRQRRSERRINEQGGFLLDCTAVYTERWGFLDCSRVFVQTGSRTGV